VSLSSLVEDALRELSEPDGRRFAPQVAGAVRRQAEKSDERYRALAEKYL